jgi:ABC-2 type transport system permease protein
VQHNVPAWTIFAMFFIVIPVVSSVMREKNEGSVFRFHILPVGYFLQVMAKLLMFTAVCMIQFVLMLCIGLFILPMLGLPVLDLGNSLSGVFVIALSTSLAASAYGVLVGTLAGTQQQGAVLGSLSILVLSALGGIWVPAYIMPDTMRTISEFSPLNWSLNGFYGLFLRGEGLVDMGMYVIKLVSFALLCIGITTWVNFRKARI